MPDGASHRDILAAWESRVNGGGTGGSRGAEELAAQVSGAIVCLTNRIGYEPTVCKLLRWGAGAPPPRANSRFQRAGSRPGKGLRLRSRRPSEDCVRLRVTALYR